MPTGHRDRWLAVPWRTINVFALVVAAFAGNPICAQDDGTALPFVGPDIIVVLDDDAEKEREIPGRIEDISGEALSLRHGGRGTIEYFRVTDIVELRFSRSKDFEAGLTQLQGGQTRRAVEYLDKALKSESRPWAWNELQATAAIAAVRGGERSQAVDRIDQIFARDRRTRHISSLPLVWDARLPTDERLPENPQGLDSDSFVQQLAAASAVLHIAAYSERASAILERLRRQSGLPRISELAETQLWRRHLLEQPDMPNPVLHVWSDRLSDLSVAARSGPQHVVGRCLLQKYDYDRAALAFLWAPLMSPDDNALAARSLAEAIQCLQMTGRPIAATRLTAELLRRFPGTSAARQLAPQPAESN